jgi:hypothetical protein
VLIKSVSATADAESKIHKYILKNHS